MTAPIICDWCDQPATRVTAHGGTDPMCNACARMNYGADWRAETWTLGVRARQAIERQRNACQVFLSCDRPATGTVTHPTLGEVPTCDRCRAITGPNGAVQ